MTDKTAEKPPVSPWHSTVTLLEELKKKKFFGTVELKMEQGNPVYARVTEGVKL